MIEDSIFTKIIKGEIPAHKIHEDKLTIVILPLHPIALGHVLVVPKLQVSQFYDLPDVDYNALMTTVKKVAKRMHEVFKPKRIGLKVEGLDVPHVHVHVIAFDNHEQYNENLDRNTVENEQELAEVAKKLAF